eukprot:COSAG03_NODE_1167_length_4661_cov_157.197109_3_plen_67_part_00
MLHWLLWLVALPLVGAMTLCIVACIELGATSPPTPRFAVPIIFTISAWLQQHGTPLECKMTVRMLP